MTNGKTEQPEYVWAYSYPYLKCVSSSWDKNVKGFETVKNLDYATVSKALGQTVTRDTVIEILSYTVSGRVDKIKIGDKTYTGVEIRTKLGLRSTDFTIDLNDNNISVTTRGFGHGVGLSQYGANEMAKQGYTYDKILHHYYTGITISKCEKL
jgi:stage II sporulation protein D